MPKVRYSNKAVEDLSSIWEYTFTQWSENKITCLRLPSAGWI